MKIATLCLLVESGRICLGIKKRKLGKDKYNGFGGMQEAGETIEQAALRELKEEAGVLALEYQKVPNCLTIFLQRLSGTRLFIFIL